MAPFQLPSTHLTHSDQETMALAAHFATRVHAGNVVFLQGRLGAGKTQFARGFCAGLGMRDLHEVDSPTYTIVNHYEAGPGVDHLDLFRMNHIADLESLAIEEMFESSSIKLIEWPERLAEYPEARVDFLVRIHIESTSSRRIECSAIRDMGW